MDKDYRSRVGVDYIILIKREDGRVYTLIQKAQTLIEAVEIVDESRPSSHTIIAGGLLGGSYFLHRIEKRQYEVMGDYIL